MEKDSFGVTELTDTQIKISAPKTTRLKVMQRIATFLAAAVCVGFLMRHLSVSLGKSTAPAGFLRGMLQGALMPAALPNLIVGNDVVIYAANNTGLTYKLGYTLGVNACGAIFFGWFFWRVSRWKKN